MKKSVLFSIIAVIIVVATILIIFMNKKDNPQFEQKQIYADIPVSTTPVKKMLLSNSISLVGSINTSNYVNVIDEA